LISGLSARAICRPMDRPSSPRPVIELGLERVRRALALLGHPEEEFASVIVAGTNGKGSVCAFLESILRAAGYRTGLFTSPHLIDVRERVRAGSRPIPASDWSRLSRRVRSLMVRHRLRLTEFEAHTLIAFLHFAEQRIDIAVVEVGLGGRLDATNVLPAPEATVVTSIGHDHREWLGPTLRHIFREKEAIARTGTPHVRSLPRSLQAEGDRMSRRKGVPAWDFGREIRVGKTRRDWSRGRQRFDVVIENRSFSGLDISLMGPHQTQNAALAVAAAESLRRRGWRVGDESIRRGVAEARWAGRFHIVRRPGRPVVILDGAHNAEAADVLARAYRDSPWGNGTASLVFGCLSDKDAPGLADRLRSLVHRVFTVPLPSPRSRDPRELADLWRIRTPAFACRSFSEAWKRAARDSGSPILITGSLYLVGTAMEYLRIR
jgi:dihydrofolate synthase / folylpolyglutamate synthase